MSFDCDEDEYAFFADMALPGHGSSIARPTDLCTALKDWGDGATARTSGARDEKSRTSRFEDLLADEESIAPTERPARPGGPRRVHVFAVPIERLVEAAAPVDGKGEGARTEAVATASDGVPLLTAATAGAT